VFKWRGVSGISPSVACQGVNHAVSHVNCSEAPRGRAFQVPDQKLSVHGIYLVDYLTGSSRW
jgi:hypothetical protein